MRSRSARPLSALLLKPKEQGINIYHDDSVTAARIAKDGGWWVAGAWLTFSYAGEKMPWLTVHIVLPMILLAGWAES
jgi:hypothetical protein